MRLPNVLGAVEKQAGAVKLGRAHCQLPGQCSSAVPKIRPCQAGMSSARQLALAPDFLTNTAHRGVALVISVLRPIWRLGVGSGAAGPVEQRAQQADERPSSAAMTSVRWAMPSSTTQRLSCSGWPGGASWMPAWISTSTTSSTLRGPPSASSASGPVLWRWSISLAPSCTTARTSASLHPKC